MQSWPQVAPLKAFGQYGQPEAGARKENMDALVRGFYSGRSQQVMT